MTSGGGERRLTGAGIIGDLRQWSGLHRHITAQRGEAGHPQETLLRDIETGQESRHRQDIEDTMEATTRGQDRRQDEDQGHPMVTDLSRLRQDLIIERDRETTGQEREGEQEHLQAHPVLLHQGHGVPETGGSGLQRPGHILRHLRVTSLTEKVTQGYQDHPLTITDHVISGPDPHQALDLSIHHFHRPRVQEKEAETVPADPQDLLLTSTSRRSTVPDLERLGGITRKEIQTIETLRQMTDGLRSGSAPTEEAGRDAQGCFMSRRSTLST